MAERSRVVKKNEFIIITNYKCAFSSLNKLSNLEIDPQITNKSKIIFNYRDIYSRNISVFLHWYVRLYYTNNYIMNFLKEVVEKDEYNNFYKLIENGEIIDAYKFFLENLHKFYFKNPHFHPQCKIIKNNKINYFFNIDKKKDIDQFHNLIGEHMPISNMSDINDQNKLKNFINNDKEYKKILDDIYEEDIIFFKHYDINIAEIIL